MNTKYKEILDILQEIVLLLDDSDEQHWAQVFTFFKKKLPQDPESTIEQILSVFGGMGSFNDLVLCKNMTPLIMENNKLETLRENLYFKIKTLSIKQ